MIGGFQNLDLKGRGKWTGFCDSRGQSVLDPEIIKKNRPDQSLHIKALFSFNIKKSSKEVSSLPQICLGKRLDLLLKDLADI